MSTDSPDSLQNRLREDVKDAMRARDRVRVSTLRMARAAIQRRELDRRESLDDAGVQEVLQGLIKQRREAATQYEKAGRADLAEKETAEIAFIRAYLPEPMSEAETADLIDQVLKDVAASSLGDMGRVMAEIRRRGAGRADMGSVSGAVRSRLRQS
ncbi:MAG: GatB/YqeY domain-containing protein [Proteobacteria bacterium]|nr:GatB/YqeY domain-containing protein [Pseudomonadota bacterium]MYJ96564.1 GatB/YqeY domain-containing protein [Pseudomonadota bacterium]